LPRFLLSACAALALALMPATALAHDGSSRHRDRQDVRREHRDSRAGHVVVIRDVHGVAGRVTAHTGNVVSVRVLDGTVVSGALDSRTKLLCIPPGMHRVPRASSRPCSAGDARPPRRILGGILEITGHGTAVWRLLIVYI
jgi:hypothetical protein